MQVVILKNFITGRVKRSRAQKFQQQLDVHLEKVPAIPGRDILLSGEYVC